MTHEQYLKIKEKRDAYLNRCRSAWVSGNITQKDDVYGQQAIDACKQYEKQHGIKADEQ